MLVHLNGQLVEHDQARVSVFDRGFIFGDALYEGLRAFDDPRRGHPRVIGLSRHVARLQRGLREVGIEWDATKIGPATDELLAATGLREAFVYWQITRGTPDLSRGPVRLRAPSASSAPTPPTVFAYASPLPPALPAPGSPPPTKRIALVPDVRWQRGDLKTTSLIANILVSIDAARAGADEAVMVRGDGPAGLVSEGSHTNVVIATAAPGGGEHGARRERLRTPDLRSTSILPGVTRDLLLGLEPSIEQGPITREELLSAREVMLVGTTTMVTAVTHVDGRPVNDGVPGPVARRLYARLVEAIREGADE